MNLIYINNYKFINKRAVFNNKLDVINHKNPSSSEAMCVFQPIIFAVVFQTLKNQSFYTAIEESYLCCCCFMFFLHYLLNLFFIVLIFLVLLNPQEQHTGSF